jgi:hypothetical protein
MGSGAMICIPSFIKTGSGNQKLIWGEVYTGTKTGLRSKFPFCLLKYTKSWLLTHFLSLHCSYATSVEIFSFLTLYNLWVILENTEASLDRVSEWRWMFTMKEKGKEEDFVEGMQKYGWGKKPHFLLSHWTMLQQETWILNEIYSKANVATDTAE